MNARRAERGHVLVEVMVSGAVLLFALTGVTAALVQGSHHANVAAHDGMAMALAEQQADQLRAQPLASWPAAAPPTPPACSVTLPASWSCTVAYSGWVADTWGAGAPAGVFAGALNTATVTVTFPDGSSGQRTVSVSAARWKDQ